jgi:hypothetical protein
MTNKFHAVPKELLDANQDAPNEATPKAEPQEPRPSRPLFSVPIADLDKPIPPLQLVQDEGKAEAAEQKADSEKKQESEQTESELQAKTCDQERLDALAPTLSAWVSDEELLKPPEVIINRFAWKGYITVYTAPDKGGKSTLMTHLVSEASRNNKRILWLCLEEPLSVLVTRFSSAGANKNIRIMAYPKNPRSDVMVAATLWKPDLIVIDTLVRYAVGSVTQGSDAQQWAALNQDFLYLSRKLGCGLLVLHHARRSDGQSRDSGEIAGMADVIIEQRKRHYRGVQKFEVRGRWALGDFALRREPDGSYSKVLVMECKSERSGKDVLQKRVLDYLTANPGASTRNVRASVKGGDAPIKATVLDLADRGIIENRGADASSKWFIRDEPRLNQCDSKQ